MERALAVEWCIESDAFKFRIELKDKPCTCRGILVTINSIFDPLGLIAPVVLVGKQILQEMSRKRLGRANRGRSFRPMGKMEKSITAVRTAEHTKKLSLLILEALPVLSYITCQIRLKSDTDSVLLLHYAHEKTHHSGDGLTLNELRSNGYWIINGNAAVRHLVSRCVACRHLRSIFEEQKMVNLPSSCVEPAPQFSYCAVDYFGPWYI